MERLTRDRLAYCFEEAGKGAPPILLIHDLGCDHTSLLPHLEHMRGRHRVVAVDLLGHGQSDRLPQAYTLAAYADDLAWLCYELGLYRPVAVGHGVGGMIAAVLAARCPDLLAGVVALDRPIVLLPEVRAGVAEATAQLPMTTRPDAVRQLVRRAVSATIGVENDGLVETIATTPHLAATWENAMVWDGATALAGCHVPLLYVQAEKSHADVDKLRHLCQCIVVESVRIDHIDHVEAAKQVNALIDAFIRLPEPGAPARSSP